ncbi:hypothetical protein C4573_02595 [Candidatus Woesearchaeota archaeon]|nr:MAG: hypothetical protein C4573_02595 [Candidatus Woesearchaeota archaeon]
MGRKMLREHSIEIDKYTKVSEMPLLYGISLPKNSLESKLVQGSKVFALNVVKHAKKETLECKKIDCFCFASAEVIECEVVQEIEAGDHLFFVGKVLHETKNYK